MSSTLFEAFLAKIYVDAKGADESSCLILWAKQRELD